MCAEERSRQNREREPPSRHPNGDPPRMRSDRAHDSFPLRFQSCFRSYRPLVTVSTDVLVRPPCAAVIVTLVDVETLFVWTKNVALLEPALTVTLVGTVATGVLLLERLTEVSTDGEAVNVTVPWELSPPFTLVGLRLTEARLTADAGVTVNVAALVTPLSDAEIVTV